MKGTFPSRGCGEVAANGIKSAMMEIAVFINHQEGEAMTIMAIGIVLAKNILAVHGIDENGKTGLVKPNI